MIFGLRTVDLALGACVTGVFVAFSGGDFVFFGLFAGIALLAALSVVRNNNRDRFLRDTILYFVSKRTIYDCLSKTYRTLAH